MSEHEQEKKKRKKKKALGSLETERAESELFPELLKGLEELEKEKKYVDIQVCPKCKSPLVRRVGSMTGDMSAHLGWTPPKYECRECGWRERTVLKATNRPTSIKDVVIMAEAKDAKNERRKKENKEIEGSSIRFFLGLGSKVLSNPTTYRIRREHRARCFRHDAFSFVQKLV